MNIKALIFDVNGTLVDIETDEGNEQIYRTISHFLTYQGIRMSRWEVKDAYFQIMSEQRKSSPEEFPEFDVVGVFREMLERAGADPKRIGADKLKRMPLFLAETYRGVSRNRLQPYPEVQAVLDELRPRFRLAAVSDGQSPWAAPELRAAGLDGYFHPVIVSGDLGYRKPDPRIFQKALRALRVHEDEVLFVGNDMYRDVYGAKNLGIKTVFFLSNQGRQKMDGVEPDYIIYNFGELRQAVEFFLAQ